MKEMKKMLLMLSLVIVSSGICSSLYASTNYDTSIKQVTPFKISSGTVTNYCVGKSTVNYKSTDEDKDVIIYPYSGTTAIWVNFNETVSTFSKTNGGNIGFPVKIGQTLRLEKFYGNIWMVNDGLSMSSTTVIILKVRNVK